VNAHPVLFLAVAAMFVAALVAIARYSFYRARRSSEVRWEDLLKRLIFIDRDGIEEIALDVIDRHGQTRKDEGSALLESSKIWALIGGWEGLKAVENNCAVLIDLAFYVQQWYPQAVAITEQLRLNAREIEWHISRLKIARQTGKLETTIPMYVQQAVATYYLMTRKVLALYEQGNMTMLAELQKAI
jgi:hypothetical protein